MLFVKDGFFFLFFSFLKYVLRWPDCSSDRIGSTPSPVEKVTPALPTSSLTRRPCVSGEFLPAMSVCLTSSRYVNPCQDALVSALQSGWKAAGTFSPPPGRPRAQIPCLCFLKGFRFIWKDNPTWGDFKTTRKLRRHPQTEKEGKMSAVSFL